MRLLALGLNHRTAGVELRERLAFDRARTDEALAALRNVWPDCQFVLLSTCNRTELYAAVPAETGPTADDLARFLARYAQLEATALHPHLYVFHETEAIRHLLEVTSSLDSLVVGEPQIPGQVKDAYRQARQGGALGKIMHRLFHCAFATAKEVYTTTSIAQRRVSIAGVAVDLAGRLFADLKKARVLQVGAGEMGELLLRHLLDVGCRPENITIATRTGRHAQDLAQQFGVTSDTSGDWLAWLTQADLVITAAACDGYLADKATFAQALARRKRRDLLAIDIAVPRNLDPAINELEEVFLYSIDDLAAIAHQHLDARAEDLATARQIIADNVESFEDWFAVRDVGPMVGQLRRRFHDISQGELDKFLAADPTLAPLTRRQLEAMVNRTVNKLLHGVIQSLHRVAREQGPEEAARFIESVLRENPRTHDRSARCTPES